MQLTPLMLGPGMSPNRDMQLCQKRLNTVFDPAITTVATGVGRRFARIPNKLQYRPPRNMRRLAK